MYLSEGTTAPPRLRTQQTLWGLRALPMNGAEWTLDEKFERVKATGFEAVECWLTDENEAEVVSALQRHGLRYSLGHRPFKTDDVRATVERAARIGADYVMAQPADAFTPLDDVVKMVVEGRKIAADHGLTLFVETHRNNFTENIPQTLALIERIPDIAITADLSHFVVVGEFYGWKEERAVERMGKILQRVGHIHGRISNGEQVQVDVGDGSGQTAQFFVELWATAMRHWLKNAPAGSYLPFSSELGPPRYAITLPDGTEFSDRWEQGLVMKRLAEQAWEKANAAA
jgi:sugar phosphate isomerase/epimerase